MTTRRSFLSLLGISAAAPAIASALDSLPKEEKTAEPVIKKEPAKHIYTPVFSQEYRLFNAAESLLVGDLVAINNQGLIERVKSGSMLIGHVVQVLPQGLATVQMDPFRHGHY